MQATHRLPHVFCRAAACAASLCPRHGGRHDSRIREIVSPNEIAAAPFASSGGLPSVSKRRVIVLTVPMFAASARIAQEALLLTKVAYTAA